MHIQIVEFTLRDITEQDYRAECEKVAGAFADLPGLISKVWLADAATGTYGGAYTWRSREDHDAYVRSELFAALKADPHLVGVRSRDFSVLEGPTRVTHGLAVAARS